MSNEKSLDNGKNGEITQRDLQEWIAKEFVKLRTEMDAGFKQVNSRIDDSRTKTNERLSRIEANIVELMH